jgi:hypothetical protein
LKTLDRQDIEDIIVAGKILGTGGGGEEEWARPLIKKVYESEKTFKLIDLSELGPKDMVVIASRIGGGVTKEQATKVANLEKTEERPELRAFGLLSEYMGQEPSAVVPTELGAGNTLAAMCTAAMLDKPTLDADCAGRAKPEVSISTTCVAGVSVTPACLVTQYGEIVFLEKTVNDVRGEDILRAVAAASGGMAGLCRSPMKGDQVGGAVVHNSVSKCIALGKSIRESNKNGTNPIESLLRTVGGLKFFEGSVSAFEREESGAFMRGEFVIEGSGSYSNHTLRVWFKNENLVSWLDGGPYVTCPDSICVVDTKTGLGLSNWGNDFARGRKVTVFGVKAHNLFRTEKGLERFSPRSFGHDIEYTPVERLVKS